MATSCFWVSGIQLTFFRQHIPYGKLSVPWSVTGLVGSSSSEHRLTQTSSHIYSRGHSDGSRWTPDLGQNTRNESQKFYGTYWEGRILLPLWLEPESVYCGIATAIWPPWGKFSFENESQGWTHLERGQDPVCGGIFELWVQLSQKLGPYQYMPVTWVKTSFFWLSQFFFCCLVTDAFLNRKNLN